MAAEETELFLETLDWTEVAVHGNHELAGMEALKQAISGTRELEGIQ